MSADDRLEAAHAAIITADTNDLCRYAEHRDAWMREVVA